jgi:3-hydroxyisobutyrate dehydrogenase
MKKIGFIGLGSMGSALAARLLAQGYELVVYNRTPEKAEPIIAKGAMRAVSPKELAEQSDVVISCVTDDTALRAVMDGLEGAFSGAKKGQVFVDMSTLSVSVTREMAKKGAEKGAEWLDAPVLGNPKMVEEGTMPFVVGGDEKALEEVRLILEAVGTIKYMGKSGLGQAAKIVHGVACAISLIAYSESLLLGDKLGLTWEQTLEVLSNGAMGSKLLTLKTPRYKDDSYTPTNARLHNMVKDISLAAAEGEAFNQKLPALSVAQALFEEAKKRGLSDEDTSSVIKVLQ